MEIIFFKILKSMTSQADLILLKNVLLNILRRKNILLLKLEIIERYYKKKINTKILTTSYKM